MRTLVIIFSVVGLMTFNSCKQEPDVQAMLQNPETRDEVIKTIAENQDFMTEFMENMQGEDMQMMQGNKKMMGTMMQGEGMQMMMKGNSDMMNMMTSDNEDNDHDER
ncbi:hypothetical protein BH23BAC2_BH23BAC2_01460 [soil metagenome]